MNSSSLSSNTIGHSPGQRNSESQDSELTSSSTQTSKILNQIKSELQEQKQQKRLLRDLHLKRVQSLRKELDYIKVPRQKSKELNMLSTAHSFLKLVMGAFTSPTGTEDNIDDVATRIENANEIDISVPNLNMGPLKTGIITNITPHYVLIDHLRVCSISNVLAKNIQVGQRIEYLPQYKKNGMDREICFVLDPLDNNMKTNRQEMWKSEHLETGNTEYNETHDEEPCLRKLLIGKVTERDKHLLFVEPNNISIDLNKVESDFIPIVGDWLAMESLVDFDTESPDLSGNLIKIIKMQPLRSKLDVGIVTGYDHDTELGIIDKTTVFTKRLCDTGYDPRIGDKVISDSIESDQGSYKWRSLTLLPIFQMTSNTDQISTLNDFNMNQEYLDDLLKNKSGIEIDNNLTVTLDINEEKSLIVKIQNLSDSVRVLSKGVFVTKKEQSQLILEDPKNCDATYNLQPSETIQFVFKCQPKFIGATKELFIFHFEGFQIGREFHIKVNALRNMLNKVLHNQHTTRNKKWNDGKILDDENDVQRIPGIAPYAKTMFIKMRRERYNIPRRFWDIIIQNKAEEKPLAVSQSDLEEAIPCLAERLSFKTYKARFRALLHLENIAQIIEIQQYSMKDVVMRRSEEYLALEVSGLAEGRPSLFSGDKAIISFAWSSSEEKFNHNGNRRIRIKYEGFIHKVSSTEVFLKFNESFHNKYNGELCRVSFECSQTTIQQCHNAINLAVERLGPNFLFPTCVIEKPPQYIITEIQNTSSLNSSLNSSSASITSSESRKKVPIAERLFNIESEECSTEIPISQNNSISNNKDDKKSTSFPNNRSKLASCISEVKKRKLRWFSNSLNCYQKEAVRNILKGCARPLPYVIFGPPGTGKTVTLCEAILQILSVIPESRILVATASNSSANLIAERLLDSGVLKPGDMVRLIARYLLNSNAIPTKLLPYCATADLAEEGTRAQRKSSVPSSGPRINCPISVLGRHRITISTCSTAGRLHNIGFPRGHFSHIMVDEAGQATEPEIMIPLSFVDSSDGQVVLAGDPLQLGPVVLSPHAQSFGLGESFLSRLLHCFPYQKDPIRFETQYDPRVVTKLLMNYRSLPQILQISNSLFYDSDLQPQVCPEQSREAKLLQRLAKDLPDNKKSPPAVLFHGVNGENCRDTDSPSWYNPEEATQVSLYLLKLYKRGLNTDNIGIITPYRKQGMLIRDLLGELDVAIPKISTVEGFQGQERDVIIISTVRSSHLLVQDDIKHSLGFIACPRRVNVAITRSRALLIIVGNPDLLARDIYWRNILKYCIEQDAYTGHNFSLPVSEDPPIKEAQSKILNKCDNI